MMKIPVRITSRQRPSRQRLSYQLTINNSSSVNNNLQNRNLVRVPLSNPASPNASALSWSPMSKTTNDTASAHSTKKSDNSLSTLPGLKLVHLNIRSLKNNAHFLELRKFTKFNKIDVLTVSETWLNTSVTNKEIEIEGYKLHRLDRLHKKGGGVCAYIRKDIKSLVLKDLSYISETNFHQLWIKLQHKKSKSLLVCVSYRPPDSPLDCFEKYFKPNYVHALTMGKLIILLGDLNCDMLKPTPGSASLIKTTKELNLNQLIKSPTRITESSQTLVDVIFVSSLRLVVNSGVIETCISDHFPVYVSLKLKTDKSPPNYITTRSYSKYDPDLFAIDLASNRDRLVSIFRMDNVDEKLTIFNEIFLNTLDKHAPVKTIKVRGKPCPFITSEIKASMIKRDQLHSLFRKTRDHYDWLNFREARNFTKTALVNAQKEHVLKEVQQHRNNTGSLWKVIKENIAYRERESVVYSKEPKLVAEEFNHFFSTIGVNAAKKASTLIQDPSVYPARNLSDVNRTDNCYPEENDRFSFTPVSCSEIRNIILAMPSNKSPGKDKVSMRVIKHSLPVILGPLTDIINCSLSSSSFPIAWKEAEVIPLLKDGNHEEASNNRPLSLLTFLSKICEKVALNQFVSYLMKNKKLSTHQSGNKKNHSCETLNLLTGDTILKAMDGKLVTALILIDLSKAFDSVNHTFLLTKLSNVGASPSAVKWFESYLTGRTQSVRIGSTVSTPLPVSYGVPQGAILSPLLFSIYTNDLPSSVHHSKLESYVDDSKILLSFTVANVDCLKQQLEEDLYLIANSCSENELLINPGKTKYMLIGTRQNLQQLPVDMTINFLNETITPVSFAKDLGMTIDSYLTYDQHITNLVSSCMNSLCQINRVKKCFDKEALTLIVSALVMNKMFYCSTVWSNTSSTNIKKLQLVQNFACRIITNTGKFDHISPGLRELNWLPVKEQLLLREAIMMYKCVNELAPHYLSDLFTKRSDIHQRDTRSHDLLQIPLYKTSAGQRSFHYRGVTIWNDLDIKFKKLDSLKTFKNELKRSMLEQIYK